MKKTEKGYYRKNIANGSQDAEIINPALVASNLRGEVFVGYIASSSA